MNVEIASKLVELRKKNGYSQESLAEKLGISRQAISKWERAEASPDTDNLILLAKIYGISLDELFGIDPTAEIGDNTEETEDYTKGTSSSGINITNDKGESVHIGWNGIHVREKDKRNVSVGRNGIHVNEENVEVNIDGDGVSVLNKDGKYVAKYGGTPVEDNQKADNYNDWNDYYLFRNSKRNVYQRIPLLLISITAYLVIGVLTNLWHPTWMIFLLIPIIDTLITAIKLRDFHRFAYPILVATVYLCLGFFINLWHPAWVIFLTIPLYNVIFPRKKRTKPDKETTYL